MKLQLQIANRGTIKQICTFYIVLISLFIAFCSFNKDSYGLVCVLLTFILVLFNSKAKNVNLIVPFVLLCCFVICLLILSGRYGERGFNAPIIHALKFVYLAFTVILSLSFRGLQDKNKTLIFKWVIVSVIISTVISLYYVICVDKYAIRYYDERGFSTVISFEQFYGICIMLCVMFFGIVSWKKVCSVRKYLFLCMLLLLCIGLSLYVTGLLISVFGIILGLFICKYNKSKRNTMACAFIVVLAIIVALIFGEQISDWIYSATESMHWIVRDRLRSVADMVFGTDHKLAYSHNRREELAGYSMQAFLQHPLFGVGYKGYGYGIIGCHQEWVDLLGVFGLVGMALFVYVIILFAYNIIANTHNKIDRQSFCIAFILFVILGFLNPCVSLPVLVAVFIIAPNISMLFVNDKIMLKKTYDNNGNNTSL